jgi:selenide,water dikinase
VLDRFDRKRAGGFKLTLISDSPVAYYSGMLPGCIAGLYRPEQIRMELEPLVERVGGKLVLAPMTALDLEGKRVITEGHPPLTFDLLSINIGSTIRGREIQGVTRRAVATRPISRLLDRIEAFDRHGFGNSPRIVIVGGGAAGVELAFALDARIGATGPVEVTIVESGPTLLRGHAKRVIASAVRKLASKEIRVVFDARVTEVVAGRVILSDTREVPFDLLVWATGAAAPPVLADTGLETDDRGFLRVRRTLQTVTSNDIFAAGDCIRFEDRDLPKAGVYAVREGPVLAENLLRRLAGRDLLDFRPQEHFLALLMTGDGQAILSWRGVAATGRWVWKLKNAIDTRWMSRFTDPAPPARGHR